MLIGDLSLRTGLSTDTLRWYEKVGLLKKEDHHRGPNNYRIYHESCLEKLLLIKECRSLGFSIKEIQQMVDWFSQEPVDCEATSTMVHSKIKAITQKINDLIELQTRLQSLLDQCDGDCKTVLLQASTNSSQHKM